MGSEYDMDSHKVALSKLIAEFFSSRLQWCVEMNRWAYLTDSVWKIGGRIESELMGELMKISRDLVFSRESESTQEDRRWCTSAKCLYDALRLCSERPEMKSTVRELGLEHYYARGRPMFCSEMIGGPVPPFRKDLH